MSAVGQIVFLLAALALGFHQWSIAWLLPLTLVMGVFSWLTDRYWKIRFYDIYGARDWSKFWLETLFGLACFTLITFFVGRLLARAMQ